nr:hypothetical protein GCM10025699_17470 [Microbacterium flavescens]
MRRYARMAELEVWYDRLTPDLPMKGLSSEFAEAAVRAIEKQSKKRTHQATARQLITEQEGRRRIRLDPLKRMDEGMGHAQRISAYEQVYDSYLASIPLTCAGSSTASHAWIPSARSWASEASECGCGCTSWKATAAGDRCSRRRSRRRPPCTRSSSVRASAPTTANGWWWDNG